MVLVLRKGSAFTLYTGEDQGYHGIFWIAREEEAPAFYGTAAATRASERVRALAAIIEQEALSPGEGGAAVLTGAGEALCWLALRCIDDVPDRSADRYGVYWAQRARERMDANLYSNEPLQTLLTDENLSYRQIARHFTRVMGESPKQYQQKRRMEEATRLLMDTRMPITSIAIELGFPSSQYFANQFQQHFGCTARAFRSNHT